LAQLPNLRELRSTQVLIRFSMRLVILVIFAAFGGIGFGRSLAALLGMTALLSAVVGILKRETPFDVALNHWDETLAYAALFCLANGLNQLVPG
jgi:hypothetical protein